MSGKRTKTPQPGQYIPKQTRAAAGELDAILKVQQDPAVVRIRVVPQQGGRQAPRTPDLEVDVRLGDGSIVTQSREFRTVTGAKAKPHYQPFAKPYHPETTIKVTEVSEIKSAITAKIFPSGGKVSQLAAKGGDLVIQIRRGGQDVEARIAESMNHLNPRLVDARFLKELHFLLPGGRVVKYVRGPNGIFVVTS